MYNQNILHENELNLFTCPSMYMYTEECGKSLLYHGTQLPGPKALRVLRGTMRVYNNTRNNYLIPTPLKSVPISNQTHERLCLGIFRYKNGFHQ